MGQAGLELGGMGMVDATSAAIAGAVTRALTTEGYRYAVIIGHSHGGIKIATGFSLLPPGIRGRVAVITYGSAHIRPFVGAYCHVNVHRNMDTVSGVAGMGMCGVGPRPILGFVFESLLGTSSEFVTLAGWNTSRDLWYLGFWPNEHSFDTYGPAGPLAPNGYSTAVPAELHRVIRELESAP